MKIIFYLVTTPFFGSLIYPFNFRAEYRKAAYNTSYKNQIGCYLRF